MKAHIIELDGFGGRLFKMYGQRLRQLRKAHKLTMEQLAEKIGIAKSSYGGYEAESKKPPLDKLVILARLYDVSVDYILGLTDDPDPKVERKNLKEFLEKPDIHWDGYKLTPEILDPIRKILKMVTTNNN